ncbi:TPA: hypothetical protein ACI7AD_004950, partial [Escherichia coli]
LSFCIGIHVLHLKFYRLEVHMTEKIQGTASVLNQTKTYEELVQKYSPEVANGLLARSINNALPNAKITPNDVAGFCKVTTALRTGKVDLEKTVKEADADAKAVSANIIEGLKTKQKSTVEKE